MITPDSSLSVILPIYNEASCITAVLDELCASLASLGRSEIIAVDDGSTDQTPALLKAYAAKHPVVRLLRLDPNAGQSAAFWAGIRAATGDIIVLMDADGQNDPADIVRCVTALEKADICCGCRLERKDTFSRRLASKFANNLRRAILKDTIIDTGCSLKAFKAGLLKPLQYWDGMHRFLPVLASFHGAVIVQIPVKHRHRIAGKSKYTNLGRLKRTAWDLFGVRWLKKRARTFRVINIPCSEGDANAGLHQ
jgi:dolichol-phosphate mannosyltransferase